MASTVQRSAEDVIGTSFVSEFLGVSSKEAQETFARALGHDKLLEAMLFLTPN